MDSKFLAAIRAQDTHLDNLKGYEVKRKQLSQRRFKKAITDDDIRDVHRFFKNKRTKPQIVNDTGLSTHTVYNILRRYSVYNNKITKLDLDKTN